MMSLSDRNKIQEKAGGKGFSPLDISSLENVDTDRMMEDEKRSPDFDRFKLLYDEPSALDGKGEGTFKRLYEFESEEALQNKEFTPLDYGVARRSDSGSVDGIGTDQDLSSSSEDAGGGSKKDAGGRSADSSAHSGTSADDQDRRKKESSTDRDRTKDAADKGFNQGFEQGKKQGYDQGFEQGKTDGFEQGFEKGRFEGFEKGETEAGKEMEQKSEEKIETLEGMLEKLDTCYQDMVYANEEKILSLVQRITEKVVFAKVEVDQTVVKNTILDALGKLAAPEEIVLMVSGSDYEYIEMVKEDFFEAVKSLKSVAVKSDPSIKPGGCRIESAKGAIETDPEEKLRKIFDSIKEVSGS